MTGIDRKTLKQPDNLTASLSSFFKEGLQEKKTILILMIVVLALGVVGVSLSQKREKNFKSGKNALYAAEKVLQDELKALSSRAVPKGTLPAPIEVDAQLSQSVKNLKTVVETFKGYPAAHEAQYKLGKLYFQYGNFSKALEWYQKAVDSAPVNFEKALALSSLGYAYENLEKPNEAIQAYQKAIQVSEGNLKADLLIATARCYETLHDPEKARSTYDQILSELPGTEYAKTAEIQKMHLVSQK